ncbi:MAG: hypothetical protein SNJ33_01690 [Rikenellaceae bacterium]
MNSQYRILQSVKGFIIVVTTAIIALALYAHAAVIVLEEVMGSQVYALVVVATIIAIISIICYRIWVRPIFTRLQSVIFYLSNIVNQVKLYYHTLRNFL